MYISGNYKTREVKIDDEVLSPKESQKLINHSPDGFSWGYLGSGPSQLALALLLRFTNETFAKHNYQQFKLDIIANIDQADFSIPASEIEDWIRKARGADIEQQPI